MKNFFKSSVCALLCAAILSSCGAGSRALVSEDRPGALAPITADSAVSSVPETSAATSSEETSSAPTTAVTTSETTAETTAAATTTEATTTSAATTTTEATTTSETTKATTTEAAAAKSTTTAESTAEATTTAPPEEDPAARSLSNPNASKEAVELYEYICNTYGSAIISGQQESTWMGSEQYEFDLINRITGKYPAIRGLDYMNDDFEGVNRRAKEWRDKGGIVTICWHCGSDFSGSWAESMDTEIKKWNKALKEGTKEYDKLIEGMDKGAKALKELCDEGIPVLWRPFHELDGGWFWWGKGGAENFVKLWRIMYDRYTNYWGLDNLIWVLGYSGNNRRYADWYPGDEYVDIAGADSYSGGACENLYRAVKKVVGDEMPVCFHECGKNPTVKELKDGKAGWVWFMTWHTSQLTDNNPDSALKELYNDEYVVTLDELPDWKY